MHPFAKVLFREFFQRATRFFGNAEATKLLAKWNKHLPLAFRFTEPMIESFDGRYTRPYNRSLTGRGVDLTQGRVGGESKRSPAVKAASKRWLVSSSFPGRLVPEPAGLRALSALESGACSFIRA